MLSWPLIPPARCTDGASWDRQGLLEALAIKMSDDLAGLAIANAMIGVDVANRVFDSKIVMCTGFIRHWDMAAWAYPRGC